MLSVPARHHFFRIKPVERHQPGALGMDLAELYGRAHVEQVDGLARLLHFQQRLGSDGPGNHGMAPSCPLVSESDVCSTGFAVCGDTAQVGLIQVGTPCRGSTQRLSNIHAARTASTINKSFMALLLSAGTDPRAGRKLQANE
jgi:hypothetical protein